MVLLELIKIAMTSLLVKKMVKKGCCDNEGLVFVLDHIKCARWIYLPLLRESKDCKSFILDN